MSIEGMTGSTPTEGVQVTDGISEVNRKPMKTASAMAGGSVGNLEKFRKENPDLWHAMMMTMATEMTNKMRKDQERLKKIMREERRG